MGGVSWLDTEQIIQIDRIIGKKHEILIEYMILYLITIIKRN